MSTLSFSTEHISFILLFMEGLLSFFSPCVIPLIPVYMSYLAGNAKQKDEEGRITYQQKKVFLHTIFFVIGISFAFFILGMSFTALGGFFKTNQTLFTKVGGILIILLGFVQVGFLEMKFLQKERKLTLDFGDRAMNPFLAFLLGFTFSFAWTPCVGPALSSVLIMASSSKSALTGNLMVFIYTAGFIIPFLLLGLFTTQALNFLKKHQKLLKYTVKLGGILLIIIGIMTFTGWMNGVSSYLNRLVPQSSAQTNPSEETTAVPSQATDSEDNNASISEKDSTLPQENDPSLSQQDGNSSTQQEDTSPTQKNDNSSSSDQALVPAFDFTLVDQYGNEHTLSDYKGKVVFLNFWATWCPPCKQELPDIEALYQDTGKNSKDVIILGIANPATTDHPNNSDVTKEEVIQFLEDNKYTFPVLFDETGEVLSDYNISAFPTTFLIDTNGNIYGYAAGMLTRDIMDNAIQQTIDSLK